MYEVVGDLAAPSFFTVDASGNVLLQRSLRADVQLQYTVRAAVALAQSRRLHAAPVHGTEQLLHFNLAS